MNKAEYQAKREWLKLNPHGMRAQSIRKELRVYEREMRAQGVDIEALHKSRTLAHGYVAYWPDRPDQPLASKVVHADRYCQHIADIPDEYVREASADERERLGRCGTCAE